jgi:lipase chaperone LimK
MGASGRTRALRWWAAALALALFALAASWLAGRPATRAALPAVPPAGAAFATPAPPPPAAAAVVPATAGAAPSAGAAPAAVAAPAPQADLAPASGKTFAVDASGRLVRNEQTRLDVEALVALTPPEQLRAAAQAQVQGLPAAAAAEALDLVERYNAYQAAQKLSFPPGDAPLVPQEALAELDGLHALRVSYFGREGAQSLFGQEEATARQLLEWMRDDTTPGLSMEQRAMRAQARYDAMRGASPGR